MTTDQEHIEILQRRVERMTGWLEETTLEPEDYGRTEQKWADEVKALKWALAKLSLADFSD